MSQLYEHPRKSDLDRAPRVGERLETGMVGIDEILEYEYLVIPASARRG